VDTSVSRVNQAVTKLSANSAAVTSHLGFVSRFQDTLTQNVGDLVDADMAKESALLTALQVKQSLGIQTMGVANTARDTLLGLFR
jgi:flagellin